VHTHACGAWARARTLRIDSDGQLEAGVGGLAGHVGQLEAGVHARERGQRVRAAGRDGRRAARDVDLPGARARTSAACHEPAMHCGALRRRAARASRSWEL